MPPRPAESTRTLLSGLLLVMAWFLAPPVVAEEFMPLDSFASSTLEIRSQAGRHWLKIYIADSTAQQMQGLMNVRSLPPDTGMIFPQQTPRIMTMWMKNTLIPLDMLFIDAGGRIVCIRERAEPESLAIISCDKPVRAVLEIAGGQVAARRIAVGDQVVYARPGR